MRVVAWSRDGTLLKRSTNAPGILPRPQLLATDTRLQTRTRNADREAFHFTEFGDCILAGCSLAQHASAMHRFTGLLLAVGGVVLAFGLGGGWWLTGRAIRPIDQISAAASRISAGNLAERINVAEADNELGRLAGVLNSTFARLTGEGIPPQTSRTFSSASTAPTSRVPATEGAPALALPFAERSWLRTTGLLRPLVTPAGAPHLQSDCRSPIPRTATVDAVSGTPPASGSDGGSP